MTKYKLCQMQRNIKTTIIKSIPFFAGGNLMQFLKCKMRVFSPPIYFIFINIHM